MFTRDLELRVRASFPCLYVVAREDWRCEQEIEKVAKRLNVTYSKWTATRGFDGKKDTLDPLDALKKVMGQPGIFSFINFHRYLDDPQMIQTVKDLIQVGKASSQTVLFVCNVWKLPEELLDDVPRIEFSLPDKELLLERLDYLVSDENLKPNAPSSEERDKIAESALGMTTWEAENAMALSLVESTRVDYKVIAKEKARAVAKSGILEFYEPNVSMSDIGGLDNLKKWLAERRSAFSKEAKEYGLPDPKGILLVGVPGCGKSLTAKAASSDWNLPLLRFDLGRLFQGLVGASEENVRRAIATAESVAPVVLWIDEIEKGMAGAGGSGSTDSGVTARVFGTLLSWMQDRQRPVFVVATANNVSSLPPELMRAGRWDEMFSIDLPSQKERAEVFKIHLKKRKRDPDKFNLEYLSAESAQFSPAEIEQVIVKGMFRAFSSGREVTTEDLMNALAATVPLSVTRREDIDALRTWAQTRAVPASSAEPPKISDVAEVVGARKLRLVTTVEEVNENDV